MTVEDALKEIEKHATMDISMFNTGCSTCLRLVAAVREATVGLNDLASWDEGAEVTGSFDYPAGARTARASLAKILAILTGAGSSLE